MRLIALVEDAYVIERIPHHINLWCAPATFSPAWSPACSKREAELSEAPFFALSGDNSALLDDGEFLIEPSLMQDHENVLTD